MRSVRRRTLRLIRQSRAFNATSAWLLGQVPLLDRGMLPDTSLQGPLLPSNETLDLHEPLCNAQSSTTARYPWVTGGITLARPPESLSYDLASDAFYSLGHAFWHA